MKRIAVTVALVVGCGAWGDSARANTNVDLTLGRTYGGTLIDPGQTNVFVFHGTPGQWLYYDGQGTDNNVTLQLLGPDGAGSLPLSGSANGKSGPVILVEPGTYSLVFSAYGTTTGGYAFRLLDLSTVAPIAFGTTLTNQLSPPSASRAFQFNGARGQRVKLQSLTPTGNRVQWRLVSPGNRLLASANLTHDLGTVTLPQTGVYVLLVESLYVTPDETEPRVFEVLLTDVSDSPVSNSGLGTVLSATLTAGATNFYAITASAGTPVYLDSLDVSASTLLVDLIDPTGAHFFSVWASADAGPWVLPRSGDYTLQVRGSTPSASGNYTLRLLDLSAAPVLGLDAPTNVALALAYQCQVYQLTAAAGRRLFFDSRDPGNQQIFTWLETADGLSAPGMSSRSDVDSQAPFKLPAPGTYYLFLNSVNPNPTSCSFEMYDVTNATATVSPLVGTLNPGISARVFRLAGTAGQTLYFSGRSPDTQGNWYLFGPDDGYLGSAGLAQDFGTRLPYSGDYVVLVSGYSTSGSINYSNLVTAFSSSTNALTADQLASGAPVTVTLAHPGDQANYTFIGTAGQRILFDSLTPDFVRIYVQCTSPSGQSLFAGSSYQDFYPVTLGENGTHVVNFSGGSSATGQVAFRLLDVGAQPAIAPDTNVVGTLDPGESTALFRLPGTAGQLLYFAGRGPDTQGTWFLFGPDNRLVASANIGQDFESRLALNGEYLLALSGYNPSGSVTFSNRVTTFNVTTNALTAGQLANGAIVTNVVVRPGDQAIYTFPAVAGQRIYYDSIQADASIYVQCTSPAGQLVFGAWSYQDLGPYTLLESGTYTLTFDGSVANTGRTVFRLLNVDSQPSIAADTNLAGVLDPGESVSFFRLSGTVGQSLYFAGRGPDSAGAWYLYGPDNALLGNAGIQQDFEATLPYTGNYLVMLAGANPSGAVTYSNRVTALTLATNTLTASQIATGALITNTLARPGDRFTFTFNGTAGQRLAFDSIRYDNFATTVQCYAPSGRMLFSINAYQDAGPLTLAETGTYTLTFDATGPVTGQSVFRLLDVTANPATPGTVSHTLATTTTSDFYAISGTAGQRLKLTSLSASSNEAYWSLYTPGDQALRTVGITVDLGELLLPVTGTYLLWIQGTGPDPGGLNYSVQIADVSESPVAANGLGVDLVGTLAANQTNIFHFTAPAGLPIYFDALDYSAPAPTVLVELDDPNGNQVVVFNSGYDSGPYVLPHPGTYTLAVYPQPGTSGTYAFRVLDLTAVPAPVWGAVITNSLNPGYRTEVYRFSGSAGQRFCYDALTDSGDATTVSLVLLDGSGPSANPPIGGVGGSVFSDSGPIHLPHSGTYFLVVQGNQANTANDSLRLVDLAAQPALPLNVATNRALPAYTLGLYNLAGSAGQNFYFVGDGNNPSGNYWTLYGPDDAGLSGTGLWNSFAVTLPRDGNYVLAMNNSQALDTTNLFQAVSFGRSTNNYTLGTRVQDVISRAGEEKRYTFAGSAGQRLYYDALTNGAASLRGDVLNPGGAAEAYLNAYGDSGAPFTLLQTGTYTLRIEGNGPATGPFDFRLIDVANQTAVPVGVTSTVPLAAYATKAYTLAGSAGQNFYFAGDGNNSSGNYWYLYDPDNRSLGASALWNGFAVTLPGDGVYALLLENSQATDVTNVFQVVTFNRFTNALTLGATVEETLTRPGETRSYTFTGAAGQRLYYDALTIFPAALYVNLVDPAGYSVISQGAYNNFGPFTLPQTGTYTLQVAGYGSATGPFKFRLLDVSTQPPLPLNIPTTVALAGYTSGLYTLAGTVGENLDFVGNPNNSGGIYWSLYTPDNRQVGYSGLWGSFPFTLPMGGVSLLVLDNTQGTTITNGFEVFTPNAGDPTLNAAPVLAPIGDFVIGEGVLLTFNASAQGTPGHPLTFSLDPDAPASASIDPITGVFRWTPESMGFSRITNFTVRVSDPGPPRLDAAQTISVEVTAGPIIDQVIETATGVTIVWRTAPGKRYRVQFRDDLDTGAWGELSGDLFASDFTTSFIDTTPAPEGHRFYRVVYYP